MASSSKKRDRSQKAKLAASIIRGLIDENIFIKSKNIEYFSIRDCFFNEDYYLRYKILERAIYDLEEKDDYIKGAAKSFLTNESWCVIDLGINVEYMCGVLKRVGLLDKKYKVRYEKW